MLVTGIILIGIVFYAIWAVRKIHKNRKMVLVVAAVVPVV